MPIPDYETLMLPVLRLFSEGARNVSDCLPQIKVEFGISDEEAEELLPSGRVTILQSRTHWARTYLSKAGLLESPKRNLHVITSKGRTILGTNPARIDNSILDQFDEFREWRTQSRIGAIEGENSPPPGMKLAIAENQTPEDAIASGHALLNATLRDELLDLLQTMTPARFERLILDLNRPGFTGEHEAQKSSGFSMGV